MAGKAARKGNLAGDGLPELADARAFRQLPDLFGMAGGVAKRREVEEIDPHRGQVYVLSIDQFNEVTQLTENPVQ